MMPQKENPGTSSVAFCLRKSLGQFMMAIGIKLSDSINLVAEERAIKEGLKYYQ